MTKDGSRWWQKIVEPIRFSCYLFFSSPVCLEVKCTWYPNLLMTHDPGVSSVVWGFWAFDTCLINFDYILYIPRRSKQCSCRNAGAKLFSSPGEIAQSLSHTHDKVHLSYHWQVWVGSDDVTSRGIEPASIPACSLSTHEIGSMFKWDALLKEPGWYMSKP